MFLSRSPDAAQPEARGPSSLLDAGFIYRILSLTHLISNSIGGPEGPFCWVVAFLNTTCLQLLWSPTHWLPVFTELYNSSITHSISLESHVWSSSGNNCHAVHRSLSSGASVYECTMGFYLIQSFQPSPPTRMCHFLQVHHFGMACLAGSKCCILIFDPAQNAIQGDAPEGRDTFQWQLGEEIAWAEIG